MLVTLLGINENWGRSAEKAYEDTFDLVERSHPHAVLGVEGNRLDHAEAKSVLGKEWDIFMGKNKDNMNASFIFTRSPLVPHGPSSYQLGIVPRRFMRLQKRWFANRHVIAGRRTRKLVAVHNSPRRFSVLWLMFKHRLLRDIRNDRHQSIIFGDFNSPRIVRQLSRLLGYKFYEETPLAFIVPKDLKVLAFTPVAKQLGRDHKAILLTVEW